MRGHCGALHNSPRVSRLSRLLPYKHPAPISPLECALPRSCVNAHSKQLTRSAKSFRMRTYKKTRERGGLLFPPSQPPFTPKPTWSYHQTGILPRLKPFVSHSYENCRGVYLFFFTQSEAKGPFWDSPLATRHSPLLLPACPIPNRERTAQVSFPSQRETFKNAAFKRAHYFGCGSAERTSRNRARTSEMRKGFWRKEGSPRAGDSGPVSVRSPVM